ncbi:MAG: Fur family transcriptional regulator [Microbacteriaceae bacterium]
MKRKTWQRTAVFDALGATEGFVGAQNLHIRLRESGAPIGLATVYRALADLAAEGAVDLLQSAEGESLYRACTPGQHHHHLICRECGRTVEIEADAVESWTRSIASSHGFTQPSHVIDVFGRCADCSAGDRLAPGAATA